MTRSRASAETAGCRSERPRPGPRHDHAARGSASEHGSGIAAIVGLVAVVVILVGAGFLILRGFGNSTPAIALVSPTPVATPVPTAVGRPLHPGLPDLRP